MKNFYKKFGVGLMMFMFIIGATFHAVPVHATSNIKGFITVHPDSVAQQNAFWYDVGLWNVSNETPGAPTEYSGYLIMGSDITAPYTSKKINDGIIAQAVITANTTYSLGMTAADFSVVYGPQLQADFSEVNTDSPAFVLNKPSIGKAYEGTTARSGAFPIFKSATVSSGTAVFNLTSDGTSTGTALFPNGVIADSVNATVSDATASYQMSWAFSNSNKTLTITTNKLTTANILSGILGQTAGNGAVVKLNVWGY